MEIGSVTAFPVLVVSTNRQINLFKEPKSKCESDSNDANNPKTQNTNKSYLASESTMRGTACDGKNKSHQYSVVPKTFSNNERVITKSNLKPQKTNKTALSRTTSVKFSKPSHSQAISETTG